MPTISPTQATLIGFVVAPGIFALCAYFTRANRRRISGAIVGAGAYMLTQYAWDRAAAVTGWWSYPAYGDNPVFPMPPAIYIFAGLVFVGFGLIGWRITRRYGWPGLVIFMTIWSLWGYLHDTTGSQLFASSSLMVIGSGSSARIADFLVYLTCMSATMLAIRLVGGPFRADALRGTSKPKLA